MSSEDLPGVSLRTKNEVYEFKAIWKIDNFLRFPSSDTGEDIVSLPFTSNKKRSDITWTIRLLPHASDGFIWIELVLNTWASHYEKIFASVVFSIVNKRDERVNTVSCESRWFKFNDHYGLRRSFPMFISREELRKKSDELLVDDDLKIECRVSATVKNAPTIPSQPVKPPTEFAYDVLNDIYVNETCTDVVLKTCNQEFKCHKSILSARSPFFKALFTHKLKENIENSVDLSEEMNAKELRDLLDYVYTGKSGNLNETCYTLCHVADVYGLDELKQSCETELLQKITPETAFELLTYAEKHNIGELKKAAAECISKNPTL